jgi:hypothetical protein
MEYEIIEEIEACYSQTILSIYTIYLLSELEKNQVYEYGYKHISGKITYKEDKLTFTITLPIKLTEHYKKEIYSRITVLNKEYEKGFFEFLEKSDGCWYEPLEKINIYSILGMINPFEIYNDDTIKFTIKCRNIDSIYPQKWLNLYFYEYRKNLRVIKERKEKEYEFHIEFLKQEYQSLKSKISISFDSDEFLKIHKHLELLKIKINEPFETYYSRQSIFHYTPDDNKTIVLLRTFGYKIV